MIYKECRRGILSYFHVLTRCDVDLINFFRKIYHKTSNNKRRHFAALRKEDSSLHKSVQSSHINPYCPASLDEVVILSSLLALLHCLRLIRGEITVLCQRKMSMDSGGPTIEDPVATYNETEPQDWGKFTTHSILRWVLFEM